LRHQWRDGQAAYRRRQPQPRHDLDPLPMRFHFQSTYRLRAREKLPVQPESAKRARQRRGHPRLHFRHRYDVHLEAPVLHRAHSATAIVGDE